MKRLFSSIVLCGGVLVLTGCWPRAGRWERGTAMPVGLQDQPALLAEASPTTEPTSTVEATPTTTPNPSIPRPPSTLEVVALEQTGPPAGTPAAAGDSPAAGAEQIRQLIQTAAQRHQEIDSYEARLVRWDALSGKRKPTQVLRFKYRQQPLSVHFKWIGKEGHGREVLWVENQNDGKLRIRTSRGDIPLMPAGKVMSISPDSPLVKMQSPHHIREAGMCGIMQELQAKLRQQETHPNVEVLRDLGQVQRPEYSEPMAGLEIRFAPGENNLLPQGGAKLVYFDMTFDAASYGLPMIVITRDHNGQEIEYYAFDRFLYPVNLDDRDFDPDFLWESRR